MFEPTRTQDKKLTERIPIYENEVTTMTPKTITPIVLKPIKMLPILMLRSVIFASVKKMVSKRRLQFQAVVARSLFIQYSNKSKRRSFLMKMQF